MASNASRATAGAGSSVTIRGVSAAKVVASELGGKFPRSYDGLRALPGIGHSSGWDMLAGLIAVLIGLVGLRAPVFLTPASMANLLTDGTLLVSDTAHHSLVHLDADGETLLRRIGDGTRGLIDGGAATARFNEPNGLALLPPDVAASLGYDVVVADNALLDQMNPGGGNQWTGTTPDFYAQAVIMELGTSFRVENYDKGPNSGAGCDATNTGRGCLFLAGGIIGI